MAYTADSWWHVELKNVDFDARSFDYWVNDTRVKTAVPFLQAADSFAVVGLHNFSAGSEAWWDDIRMHRSIGIVPADGSVPPGESAEITLYFDTARLYAWDYAARIVLDSNDPLQPEATVSVDLIVGPAVLTVSDTDIDFGGIALGETSSRNVNVSNTGERDLVIDWITIDRPVFTPAVRFFRLAAGESYALALLFTPDAAGPIEATLHFASDDPHEGVPSIRLRGAGQANGGRGGRRNHD